MDSSLRVPLVILEVAALAAVLYLVDDPTPRLALGLAIALLLARSAMINKSQAEFEGPPEGLPERRTDHLFRHWVNVLMKKVREFHAVCQSVREEQVSLSAGRMKVEEIELELEDLMSQVMELAKPPQIRRKYTGRRPSIHRPNDEQYGEPARPD